MRWWQSSRCLSSPVRCQHKKPRRRCRCTTKTRAGLLEIKRTIASSRNRGSPQVAVTARGRKQAGLLLPLAVAALLLNVLAPSAAAAEDGQQAAAAAADPAHWRRAPKWCVWRNDRYTGDSRRFGAPCHVNCKSTAYYRKRCRPAGERAVRRRIKCVHACAHAAAAARTTLVTPHRHDHAGTCQGLPPPVANGRWPESCRGTTTSSSCTASCISPFFGAPVSTCQANGAWSAPAGRCLRLGGNDDCECAACAQHHPPA